MLFVAPCGLFQAIPVYFLIKETFNKIEIISFNVLWFSKFLLGQDKVTITLAGAKQIFLVSIEIVVKKYFTHRQVKNVSSLFKTHA